MNVLVACGSHEINLRSACDPTAIRLRSACGSHEINLRSACDPTAINLRIARDQPAIRLRSDCDQPADRTRSTCDPTAINLRSACDPTAISLRIARDQPAIRLRSESMGRFIVILNTDWMGLSLHLLDDVGCAPRGYQWQEYEGGTNVWGARRVLYNDHGERVFTLLSQPKSSIHDGNAALLEVSNEWLYHGIGVDGCLTLLKRCVPFDVSGISRLDLACDFVPNEEQRNVIDQLASGSMYVAGKRSGSGFWSINTDEWMPDVWRGRKIPHCISWGHKTSDVKWKLYYKSKELHDAAGGKWFEKPYIVDQWRINGMDVENVWRLELSIKHGNKLTFRGTPIDLDVWRENRTLLWHGFYQSRFVIRRSEGHADKRNDEQVWFLPSYEAGDVKCKQYEGDQMHCARIALLRKLVQSCDEPEVYMDAPTRKSVIDMVTGMVQRDGLSHYFRGMTGLTLSEWIANVEANGGGGTMPIQSGNNFIAAGIRPNTKFDTNEQNTRN